MINPNLKFEKWTDPFENDNSKDELEVDEDYDRNGKTPILFLHTSQGVSLLGNNLASKNFNLYLVHTNFRIDTNIKALMMSINGIESYEDISPYRVRISIGRLFSEDDVKNLFKDKVLTFIKNNYLKEIYGIQPEKLDSIKKELNKHKFWAILISKTKISTLKAESKEEIEKLVNESSFEQIIKSWV